MQEDSRRIAMYVDLENVAIGVRDARIKSFDIQLVLGRLLEKGVIVVRRAYADWSRFQEYTRPLHEAGVELTELPGSKLTGKNSADIKMVVDALQLCYTNPHIDTFALITGDSDFSPLVSKLRENNKHTLGIGVKGSTSSLLIDGCDEFILYDDLIRPTNKPTRAFGRISKKKKEGFELLMDAVEAIQREGRALHGSLVKETMRRKQPQFNEEYHGYRSFSELLEDAQKIGLIKLHKDAGSGTWVIDPV